MIDPTTQPAEISADRQKARELLAKLYREIGILAVATELGVTFGDESEADQDANGRTMPEHGELAA